VTVGRWLQLAGVVKGLERKGSGDYVVAVKSKRLSLGRVGQLSCGGILRCVMVGRWLQLAGVVKLPEDNGGGG
jgi:hypothetical protein